MFLIEVMRPDYITVCCGTRKMSEIPNETSSDTMIVCGKCGDMAYLMDTHDVHGFRSALDSLPEIAKKVKEKLLAEEKYEDIKQSEESMRIFEIRYKRIVELMDRAIQNPDE
jgi:hypothetical protein